MQLQSQRGMTLVSLVIVGLVLAFFALIAAKLVPGYVEYLAIKKVVTTAAAEETSVAGIRKRLAFGAMVDDIESIQGDDLIIEGEPGAYVVSFEYERETHVAGPAYIVMKYKGSSADK